jgi:hypothetical protein
MGDFQRFPAEIRDMIFQHLLDARYTRLERRTCDDPAYKFHTNILAVNRAIHAEARKLLTKRNIFIAASHTLQLDDESRLMRKMQLWVPLVAWKSTVAGEMLHYTATMKQSSLQVHFTYSPDGTVNLSNPLGLSVLLRDFSCVFLAADLVSYCSVLSARMGTIVGPDVFLPDHGPLLWDRTMHLDGSARSPASLAISWRKTIPKETMSRVYSLLSPFHDLIAPSLHVDIGTVVNGRIIPLDNSIVKDHRRRMGPSLTCKKAADWAFFERYEKRKTIADFTALGGELNLALAMYEDMLPTVSSFSANRLHHPFQSSQSCYAVRLLEADLLMTKAHIHCKLGNRATFKATIMLANEILGCYRDTHCDFAQQPGTLEWIKHLIIMAVLGLDGDIGNVPLRCIDLRRTSDFARKPEYMVRWMDLKGLSQTAANIRTIINERQMARGFPLTYFPEIDEVVRQQGW